MGRALKFLFRIAILAALGFVGYALLADLPPPTEDMVIELEPPTLQGQ